MIKCCQNCHNFNRSSESCESGELKVIADVEYQIVDLLEGGVIHGLCDDLGLPDDDSETGDLIAEFLRKHLTCDVDVRVKDYRNFCCNAWR